LNNNDGLLTLDTLTPWWQLIHAPARLFFNTRLIW